MSNPEFQLQIHVIRYLRGKIRKGKNVIQTTVPFPDLTVFHPYAGRSEQEGFFLKELGVLPGVSDLLVIAPNFFAGIELKTSTGRQSEYQKNFQSKMISCGFKYTVCRSVAEVRDTLIAWGLECRNPVCIEPPRSFKEQKVAAFNFFAPNKGGPSQ